MSCTCNLNKLPSVSEIKLLTCVSLTMNNGQEYIIKQNDLVGIQFVKCDKKILVRRGRVKEIKIVNRREIGTCMDNASYIILDCSEQFTVKTVEIKIKDIIKIGSVYEKFDDYDDRVTELIPNFIEGSTIIPTREFGMYTEKEWRDKIIKPNKSDVVSMDSSGQFADLKGITPEQSKSYSEQTSTKTAVSRGIPIMK